MRITLFSFILHAKGPVVDILPLLFTLTDIRMSTWYIFNMFGPKQREKGNAITIGAQSYNILHHLKQSKVGQAHTNVG